MALFGSTGIHLLNPRRVLGEQNSERSENHKSSLARPDAHSGETAVWYYIVGGRGVLACICTKWQQGNRRNSSISGQQIYKVWGATAGPSRRALGPIAQQVLLPGLPGFRRAALAIEWKSRIGFSVASTLNSVSRVCRCQCIYAGARCSYCPGAAH